MSSTGADEAFREGDEDCARVRAPFDPAIVEDCDHLATQRAPQRRHAVAGREAGGLPERVNDGGHVFLREDARDVVRNGRRDFFFAREMHFAENCIAQSAPDFSKRVAVKEEKWSPAMTALEKLQSLQQA